ncbi:MAG: chemotaxis protein CheW [Kiritimatiellae bacterium]|nr:chemotaxis protein CheW [Kiritimatiellia bacterium]MDD4735659.1 chemotaxis protein CheW [Kiritimatiellia bacterium]
MLFLFFQANEQAYALEISCVEEVVPYVVLRSLPEAPPGVPGLMNYRGSAIPVVDLSAWLGGAPARNRLSTRLVIIQVDAPEGVYRLALMVEGATETRSVPSEGLRPSGVVHEKLPCLGEVFVEGESLVQVIDPNRLLTDALKAVVVPIGRGA